MAIGDLPVLGLVSYNGYEFNETTDTVGYSIKPVYDSSHRTVTASEFTITLKWIIANEGTTDVEVQDMVAALQRPAGILEYTGRGFGVRWDLINRGVVRDVSWGPHPGEVRLIPIGAGRSVECQWTVQFTIPTCDDGVFRGIREFCFTVDYAIDSSGYTTRTFSGAVKIAQTRRNVDDRVPIETADNYYERVVPARIPGFRRESQTRRLSEDRNSLTVTVVDVELPPTVLPSGLISASVEHAYNATPNTHLLKWTGTFSASYEVAARDGNVGTAVEDFADLTRTRIDRARGMIVAGAGGRPGATVGRAIIPIGYSVAEGNVYGRQTARFSLSYFVAGVELSEILRSGGLWNPWDGIGMGRTPAGWMTSVSTAFSPRGNAVLAFRATDDRILDLCEPGGTPAVQRSNGPPSAAGILSGAARSISTGVSGAGGLQKAFPPPKPDESWIDYKQFVSITTDSGRVVVSTLPDEPLSAARGSAQGWDAISGNLPATGPTDHPFPPLGNAITNQSQSGSRGTTTVQQRTAPTLYVTLHGYALRCNHEIPCPELIKVNGKTPTLVGQPEFSSGVVGNAMYPVYGASWRLTYLFEDGEDLKKRVPAPPNPVLG